MKRLGAALCLAFAAACVPSTTKTEITNVVQENPTGAVGGIVLDYFAGTPLGGATVTLFTARGPLTATSDATTGFYTFDQVPVGSFTVVLNVTGYGPAVLTGTLDSTDPNRPVLNPQTTLNPIGLIKLDQTFNVRVVDESGAPVAGAVVSTTVPVQFVEWATASELQNGVGAQARGNYNVTATSDAMGNVALAGLPAFAKLTGLLGAGASRLTLSVAPILVTGSTQNYSFNGGSFLIDVLDVNGTNDGAGNTGRDDYPTIVLEQPDNALRVVKSSVEYLEDTGSGLHNVKGSIGAIVTAAPITIQFNNALASAVSISVQEVDEHLDAAEKLADRVIPSALTFTPTVSGNVLTLAPSAAPTAGRSYWATLQVTAAQKPGGAARTYSTIFPFWGATNPTIAARATNGAQLVRSTCNPNDATDYAYTDEITVLLNEPIGIGGGADPTAKTFHCVMYATGASFDGAPASLSSGEIDGDKIICDPAAVGGRGDATYVSQPTPIGGAATGFTAKWKFIVSTPAFYECSSNAPTTCSTSLTPFLHPNLAGPVRLSFRFQSGASIVRRVDGTPVTDISITPPSSPVEQPSTACPG